METGVIRSLNGPTEAKFGKKYSFNIDGQWYDMFTKYPLPAGVAQGAQVEYIAAPGSGGFNAKITKIKATGLAPSPGLRETPVGVSAPQGASDRELAIMRQNAVTNANAFLNNNKIKYGDDGVFSKDSNYTLKELLEVAEILTSYYRGEIDPTEFEKEDSPQEAIVAKIKAAAGV
jgi:hypothetical protein